MDYSQLPSVHALADQAGEVGPRWAVVEAARRVIAAARLEITAGREAMIDVGAVAELAGLLVRPHLRRVINATGVVLHTNLGRAPLSIEARAAIDAAAAGYTNLEYDLAKGERGSRHDHLRALVVQLTGAEDAIVVNNNAAATVLGLAALAQDREIVVSRGELIEIGGSFRLPEILALSGGKLVEVGTTNKTHARDYEQAIGPSTGLLLKVHRSNFAMVGFTAEVLPEELVAIGRAHGIATMIDLGSGMMLDRETQRSLGLPEEPTIREAVASGADLVTFSGDKLLGGPQAGLLVGKTSAVERARTHPLMRALRPDKLTLAALEATLAMYRDGNASSIPTHAMLARTVEQLRAMADAIVMSLCVDEDHAPGRGDLEIRPCISTVGGGAMPTAELPSIAVTLPERHEARLRGYGTPIIGRVAEGRVWLDLRTVTDQELFDLIAAVQSCVMSPA